MSSGSPSDANEFRPERFLDGATADSLRFDVPRRGFLPFGYGVRTCIGYHMAILEARATVDKARDNGWTPRRNIVSPTVF